MCLLATSSGCHTLREDMNDFMVDLHSRKQARSAWYAQGAAYADIEYRSGFQSGFEAGYLNVAQGGAGSPPALGPARYRSWWYQNESGQLQSRAWMDGYSEGAIHAQQNDAAQWNQIVVSIPRRPPMKQTNSTSLPPPPPMPIPGGHTVFDDDSMSDGPLHVPPAPAL